MGREEDTDVDDDDDDEEDAELVEESSHAMSGITTDVTDVLRISPRFAATVSLELTEVTTRGSNCG